jgi:hypothetical protein
MLGGQLQQPADMPADLIQCVSSLCVSLIVMVSGNCCLCGLHKPSASLLLQPADAQKVWGVLSLERRFVSGQSMASGVARSVRTK